MSFLKNLVDVMDNFMGSEQANNQFPTVSGLVDSPVSSPLSTPTSSPTNTPNGRKTRDRTGSNISTGSSPDSVGSIGSRRRRRETMPRNLTTLRRSDSLTSINSELSAISDETVDNDNVSVTGGSGTESRRTRRASIETKQLIRELVSARKYVQPDFVNDDPVGEITLDEKHVAVSLKNETYIPLGFTQKKLDQITQDWNKMKQDYVKAFNDLKEHYKKIETEQVVCTMITSLSYTHSFIQ
jgi:hypothetical protein